MKMSKRAEVALRGSIEKWEKIVNGTGRDTGPQNCPLCRAYWVNGCQACPVKKHTGEDGCNDTPFDAWSFAHHDFDDVICKDLIEKGQPYYKERRALARQELRFLISLLPQEGE